MSEKEIDFVASAIKRKGKLIAKDKAKTTSFLKKIGILNKKSGKVSNAYKEICIPIEQA